MVREVTIDSFQQIRALQSAASQYNVSIGIHDANGSIADAKSILGLMSLDYSKPVKIVVNDEDSCLLNILTRCLSEEACLRATFERLNPCLKRKINS